MTERVSLAIIAAIVTIGVLSLAAAGWVMAHTTDPATAAPTALALAQPALAAVSVLGGAALFRQDPP